ncbi:hypothetical protein [Cryobacterium aureum]|uniref:hypothetical protein n=1 Tax=Cryobacterium aureum TaxID=995037 RepID=UPI000CF4F327|nr:hypothetical protein [Cryobacterium aureum]
MHNFLHNLPTFGRFSVSRGLSQSDKADKADEEAEVKSDPEVVYGVEWSMKKYKTIYSVPVKANMVQLGFLSVNNAKVGAIGGPQRAAVLWTSS